MAHDPAATPEGDALGLERMLFFSDAVFAIVITLLALDLRLPEAAHGFKEAELRRALLELTPKYFAFVISFLVVGMFWLGHHRKFRIVKSYDLPLLRVNLLLLMAVTLVPFSTSVLSEGGGRTGVVLYAANMVILGLLSTYMSWRAHRNDMIDAGASPLSRRVILSEPLKVTAIFALSILLAQWRTDVALMSWLLLIPATLRFKGPRKSRPQAGLS